MASMLNDPDPNWQVKYSVYLSLAGGLLITTTTPPIDWQRSNSKLHKAIIRACSYALEQLKWNDEFVTEVHYSPNLAPLDDKFIPARPYVQDSLYNRTLYKEILIKLLENQIERHEILLYLEL